MVQWFPYLSQGVAAGGHVGGVHGIHGVMLVALAVILGVVVGDTQSDSIQYLNFAKK